MRAVGCPRMHGTVAVLAGLVACGDPAARVTLVPVGCPKPGGSNQIKVTAFAPGGERSQSIGPTDDATLNDFPADTEQLGVEVLVDNGAIGATGKSMPLVFDRLANGAAVPVQMGPLEGFCEVGGMAEARARPLVLRAGDGALVIGGAGASGPLATAEYYDPATASFASVAVPEGLIDPQGVTGMAGATLPDGRVALLGGPAHALLVFDPRQRAFTIGPLLIASRAFHAAIATGADDVIVAGGCFDVEGEQCSGVALHQVQRYNVTRPGPPDVVGLPSVASVRIGAQLFDLGVQLDGAHSYVLAGGTTPGADRFRLSSEPGQALAGSGTQATVLDGGAVLAAFAPSGMPPSGAATVYTDAAAEAIAAAPARAGTPLVTLEDGRVLAIDGDGVVTYEPARNAWRTAQPATLPAGLGTPSAVRLGDGSVLVVGGTVSPRAWLYRPSLVGPASGAVMALPTSEVSRGVLTAPDPRTVTRTGGDLPAWILATVGEAPARALAGGPRMATGSVRALVHVLAGGAALIAQEVGPGEAVRAEFAPDQAPRLVQYAAGGSRVVCSGDAAVAFDPALAVSLRLAITGGTATVTVDDREVLRCALTAAARGAWGVAAIGAGARVAVDSVAVAR